MNHLTEGIVQRYLDGELGPHALQEVTAHLAACTVCARAVDEAERELAMMATALGPDLCATVPTSQLREQLAAGLAVQRSSVFTFKKISLPLQTLLSRCTLAPYNFKLAATAITVAVVVAASVVSTIKFVNLPESSTTAVQENKPKIEVPLGGSNNQLVKNDSAPYRETVDTHKPALARRTSLTTFNQKPFTRWLKRGKVEAASHTRAQSALVAKSQKRQPSAEQIAGEKAKEQVILALQIASAELRLAQQQLQPDAGVE